MSKHINRWTLVECSRRDRLERDPVLGDPIENRQNTHEFLIQLVHSKDQRQRKRIPFCIVLFVGRITEEEVVDIDAITIDIMDIYL